MVFVLSNFSLLLQLKAPHPFLSLSLFPILLCMKKKIIIIFFFFLLEKQFYQSQIEIIQWHDIDLLLKWFILSMNL